MKNTTKTVRTVSLMVLATLLSKALGLLRNMLLLWHYGTGVEANAFSAASKIPLSFFDLLFSAAIVGCFIPVYNRLGEDKERNDRFACTFLNAAFLGCGLLAVLGMVFAPFLISVSAPGLPEETAALAVKLLRILFPMILFAGGSYTLVGVLQSKGWYILPAMISTISNAAVVLYFLFFDVGGERGILWLSVMYVISWVLQFLTLLVPLLRSRFRYRPILDWKDRNFRRALKNIPPIMFGSWLIPAGVLIGTFFSSFFEPGGVTVFDVTNNFYVLAAGILSYSICNFIFPKLSKMSGKNAEDDFAKTSAAGLKVSLFIVLPFMAALFLLCREGVAILYLRDAFSAEAAQMTSDSLQWMVIGMPAFALIEMLSRIFYSKEMVKIPMAAALCGVAVNAGSAFLFVKILGLGLEFVSLANACGQIMAAVLLILCCMRKIKGIFTRDFGVFLLKSLICCLLSGAVMVVVYHFAASDVFACGILRNILTVLAVFGSGMFVYLIGAKFLRITFMDKTGNVPVQSE